MPGKEQPEEQVKGQVVRMTLETENVQRPNENNDLYRDALTGAYNRRFYEDQLRSKYQPSV